MLQSQEAAGSPEAPSFVIPVTENLICTLTVTSGNESVNKHNHFAKATMVILPDYNTAIRIPDVRLNITL